ncbi:hypothetical protein RND81_01G008500 [Saponaria officinalis]|uniref:Transmembrane protein n=1 Tax=Saponaria officinalis TaxID=3572 RepID=A0AAW1NBQ3_SAPOF
MDLICTRTVGLSPPSPPKTIGSSLPSSPRRPSHVSKVPLPLVRFVPPPPVRLPRPQSDESLMLVSLLVLRWRCIPFPRPFPHLLGKFLGSCLLVVVDGLWWNMYEFDRVFLLSSSRPPPFEFITISSFWIFRGLSYMFGYRGFGFALVLGHVWGSGGLWVGFSRFFGVSGFRVRPGLLGFLVGCLSFRWWRMVMFSFLRPWGCLFLEVDGSGWEWLWWFYNFSMSLLSLSLWSVFPLLSQINFGLFW